MRGTLGGVPEDRFAAAELCGPVVLLVMSGSPAPDATALRAHAARLAKAWA
ncbi:hypothetical protein [Streptomyces sp. SPB78]|uniref:hypothetical protein n=1 Tax=Streptomyces sp. (strain SPB78) TaxID=591157 RepID=UPI003B63F176